MRFPVGTKIFIGTRKTPQGTLVLTEQGLELYPEGDSFMFAKEIKFLHELYPTNDEQTFIYYLQAASGYEHWNIVALPPDSEYMTIKDVIPKTAILKASVDSQYIQ